MGGVWEGEEAAGSNDVLLVVNSQVAIIFLFHQLTYMLHITTYNVMCIFKQITKKEVGK